MHEPGLSETLAALGGQLRRVGAGGAFADAVERSAALGPHTPLPASLRAALLERGGALLRAEDQRVVDERVYAWTRMLVAKLDGDAARPYLGRVAVGHREAVIAASTPVRGRRASRCP